MVVEVGPHEGKDIIKAEVSSEASHVRAKADGAPPMAVCLVVKSKGNEMESSAKLQGKLRIDGLDNCKELIPRGGGEMESNKWAVARWSTMVHEMEKGEAGLALVVERISGRFGFMGCGCLRARGGKGEGAAIWCG
ncbi:hypothetical protein GOBAR_AA01288 [Gossypium barbadense]|uniref:Uncharacterized protein n=1 Tax=Gossypium barbadense TaxID=3634 RepID=A0A2P5YUL5_GOSBA|nr:hypothetical protein GOBAR_AA01288 [Gossypium barbadense]